MSVYKTVCNYFYGVLDFLESKEKQHKTLEAYFNSINHISCKELMVKLSDTILRINILFRAKEEYWKSLAKEQHTLFAIFVTILTIVGVIFTSIFYLRVKKESSFRLKDGSINTRRIFKTSLTYIIIYMTILTIFLMLIIREIRFEY